MISRAPDWVVAAVMDFVDWWSELRVALTCQKLKASKFRELHGKNASSMVLFTGSRAYVLNSERGEWMEAQSTGDKIVAAASLGGTEVMVAGTSSFAALDVARNTWRRLPNGPEGVHTLVPVDDGRVVATRRTSEFISLFQSGEWMTLPRMPSPLVDYAVGAVDGKLYVGAGCNLKRRPKSDVWVLDMATSTTWAKAPEARAGWFGGPCHKFGVLGKRLYAVCSTLTMSLTEIFTVQFYDTITGAFMQQAVHVPTTPPTTNLPSWFPRRFSTASFNGRLVLMPTSFRGSGEPHYQDGKLVQDVQHDDSDALLRPASLVDHTERYSMSDMYPIVTSQPDVFQWSETALPSLASIAPRYGYVIAADLKLA